MSIWNDPAYYWIPCGALAFLFAVINLIRAAQGKKRGRQLLQFLSLSFGLFTMLSEYQMVNKWVQHGDWAALEDVVPPIAPLLTSAVFLGVLLNLAALVIGAWNERKGRS